VREEREKREEERREEEEEERRRPNPYLPSFLISVIPGLATSKDTLDATLSLAKEMGKTTTVSQDVPGFIANRILMPYINEVRKKRKKKERRKKERKERDIFKLCFVSYYFSRPFKRCMKELLQKKISTQQ
jgi:hypothetical protein